MAAVIQTNTEWGHQLIDEVGIERALVEASDSEIELIAGAVQFEGYREMLGNAVVDADDTASIGAVYDPTILLEGSVHRRLSQYFIAINAAHTYMRGPISNVWELYNEPQEVRDKAKRYVAIYCAVTIGGMRKPSNDIADLALNANDDDYEKILTALRNDREATLEQINFILDGGPSAISAGAL